ncbi:MAG: hypothetical protein PHD03_03745 [Bacilli bacterium]|nr:hypothetical protein [Bacilli bacterium]MDD4407303.1 hypothetical protein [Bacilli bacterium]
MKKIKLLLLTFVMFMVFGITNVNAIEASETYQKVFPNGEFEMHSIPFKTPTEASIYLYYAIQKNPGIKELGYGVDITNCDENLYCDGELSESCSSPEECAVAFRESNRIKLVFNTYDKNIDKKVNALVKKVADGSTVEDVKYYSLTDLNLINYYASRSGSDYLLDLNKSINFITELRKDFEHSNLTYTFNAAAGDDYPLYHSYFGWITVFHNDIAYGYIDPIGVQEINTLYIPSNTKNTSEAYISAAKNRIKQYLGYDVEITQAGLRNTLKLFPEDPESPLYDFSLLGDESLMGNYYYNIKLNNINYQFVIIRDSNKMTTPVYKSKDLKTNIGVSSSNGTIPLDANIFTNIIIETEDYKIKVNSNNIYVVDIQLKSTSKTDYVAKLDNGKYLVSIPVPENLNGKEIIAYYISSAGKKEEHIVIVKDGYASFETDHFSTYILAEKTAEPNPQTYDAILGYIILGIIGLIGIYSSTLYLRKSKIK